MTNKEMQELIELLEDQAEYYSRLDKDDISSSLNLVASAFETMLYRRKVEEAKK